MMSPPKKYIYFGLSLLCIYFVLMDISLYKNVQKLRRNVHSENNGTETFQIAESKRHQFVFHQSIVKTMMMDHVNHYIRIPLVVAFDKVTDLSHRFYWITPNVITVFHFLVACVSAKFASSDSLIKRRFACLLFQFRTWLDSLDGFVARARNTDAKTASSFGRYLDDSLDVLGTAMFLFGCIAYLRRDLNSDRSLLTGETKVSHVKSETAPSSRYSTLKIVCTLQWYFGAQLLVGMFLWDWYAFEFKQLLESPTRTLQICMRQETMLKSTSMYMLVQCWSICNPQTLLDMMLAAVFFNKFWGFVFTIRYLGYALFFVLFVISEIQLHHARLYIGV